MIWSSQGRVCYVIMHRHHTMCFVSVYLIETCSHRAGNGQSSFCWAPHDSKSKNSPKHHYACGVLITVGGDCHPEENNSISGHMSYDSGLFSHKIRWKSLQKCSVNESTRCWTLTCETTVCCCFFFMLTQLFLCSQADIPKMFVIWLIRCIHCHWWFLLFSW